VIPELPSTPDTPIPFDLIDICQDLGVAAQSGTAKSILVAGQALAFWGAYYLDEHAPAEYDTALASRDIDFFEPRIERVRACWQTANWIALQQTFSPAVHRRYY